ncbi:DUF1819 family protein [Psychromicrobium xiongbiense]|uniref:DUF1819 family protein n=1 Tax=Psychromicrobium xiongbiense TaxID=3051184 RepID=UPI002557B1A8|nr:DUF1819 family protein [Psychromicrobium sp. YIM S02556]
MVADHPRSRYALSFTSGGLLAREGEAVAEIYLATRDWSVTRARVMETNVLQARTVSSSERLGRETIQRISVLSDKELELLTEASYTEQRHLMWAAACRRYDIIGDFAEEVLRERFLLMTPTLSIDDVERFLTGKSLWHPELDEVKPSTRQKLRRALFQMLREAGLRTSNGDILPVALSTPVAELLRRRTPSDLRFFPTTAQTTPSNFKVQQ